MSTVEQAQAELTAAQAAYNTAINTRFEQLHAVLELAVSNDPLEALGTRAGDTLAESLIAEMPELESALAPLTGLIDSRIHGFMSVVLGDESVDRGSEDLDRAPRVVEPGAQADSLLCMSDGKLRGASGGRSDDLGVVGVAAGLCEFLSKLRDLLNECFGHVLAPSSVVGEGSVEPLASAPEGTDASGTGGTR